jgi:hypothetical protein
MRGRPVPAIVKLHAFAAPEQVISVVGGASRGAEALKQIASANAGRGAD